METVNTVNAHVTGMNAIESINPPAPLAARVLVVDDDSEVTQAIAHMLAQLGYLASTCSHVEEALRILETAKIDLVLVDYRMPDLTGLDLISALKQEGSTVPAILLTGYLGTEERLSAEHRSQLIVLKKPITLEQLGNAVEVSLQATTPTP